jgi:hypothetical protein
MELTSTFLSSVLVDVPLGLGFDAVVALHFSLEATRSLALGEDCTLNHEALKP